MKKDELINLGLTEDQATAVMDKMKDFVPKTRLDEVIAERNGLKDQVAERDKQIDGLKATAGDNQVLKDQIAELQQTNKTAAAEYEKQLTQVRLDNAVELAISGAKARNAKAVKALLDLTNSKLGDDGKVDGLEAQIKALQKSDPYLFAEATTESQPTPQIKGMTIQNGSGTQPAQKSVKEMTYSELCAYMEAGGKLD